MPLRFPLAVFFISFIVPLIAPSVPMSFRSATVFCVLCPYFVLSLARLFGKNPMWQNILKVRKKQPGLSLCSFATSFRGETESGLPHIEFSFPHPAAQIPDSRRPPCRTPMSSRIFPNLLPRRMALAECSRQHFYSLQLFSNLQGLVANFTK